MNCLENDIHFYYKENRVTLHLKKGRKNVPQKGRINTLLMTTIKRNFLPDFLSELCLMTNHNQWEEIRNKCIIKLNDILRHPVRKIIQLIKKEK